MVGKTNEDRMEIEEQRKIWEEMTAEMEGTYGAPSWVIADPEANLAEAKRCAKWLADKPCYKNNEIVIVASKKEQAELVKARGLSIDDAVDCSCAKWAHKDFAVNFLAKTDDATSEDLVLLEQFKGLGLCLVTEFEAEKLLIVMQPLKAHYITKNDSGSLVCTRQDGFAIEYADGTGIAVIDDIVCPDWIITDQKPTAEMIVGIVDVDVRAIAIRKFGASKIIDAGVLVDSEKRGDIEYKLYDLQKPLNANHPCYYLHFHSVSVDGLVHVEGVEGATVKEAMAFRSGVADWYPLYIDGMRFVDGNTEQHQHGDVNLEILNELPDLTKYEKLSDRNFVLSPENQKRHKIVGDFELYENGLEQILIAKSGTVHLTHPEHGDTQPIIIARVFPTMEKDWIADVVRVTVD